MFGPLYVMQPGSFGWRLEKLLPLPLLLLAKQLRFDQGWAISDGFSATEKAPLLNTRMTGKELWLSTTVTTQRGGPGEARLQAGHLKT